MLVVREAVEGRPNWNPIFVDVKRGRGAMEQDSEYIEKLAGEILQKSAMLVPLSKDEKCWADYGVVLKA